MKLFGVTGGIGMGKSTAARLLQEMGVAVVDTDRLARMLVEPGQPSLEEISAAFGPEILAHDGHLDRRKLAELVFSNKTELTRLEAILHPKIRQAWQAQVTQWKRNGEKWGAVVIPLLFETDVQTEFDAILCVACSSRTQLERLHERGWSENEISRRNEAQMAIEEKMNRAHRVIWSDTTIAAHGAQLRAVLEMETGQIG